MKYDYFKYKNIEVSVTRAGNIILLNYSSFNVKYLSSGIMRTCIASTLLAQKTRIRAKNILKYITYSETSTISLSFHQF